MAEEFNCSATGRLIPLDQRNFALGRWQLCTALYVILMVSPFLFVPIFYWGKTVAKFERLRVRRMAPTYIAGFILILYAQVGPGTVTYGVGNVNCGLKSFLSMIIVPIMIANITLRLLIFYFLSELSRELTNVQSDDVPAHQRQGCQGIVQEISDLGYVVYALFLSRHRQADRSRLIRALSFVASSKGTIVMTIAFLTPFLAVALGLVISDESYRCSGCKLSSVELGVIIGGAAAFLLLAFGAALRVRHYPDPWQLKTEAVFMLLSGVVILVGFVLNVFSNPSPDMTYDHQLIIVAGFIGYASSQSIHQVVEAYKIEKLSRTARGKARVAREEMRRRKDGKVTANDSVPRSTTTQKLSSDGSFTLKEILENPVLVIAFEKFLVDELGMESLMFLRGTEQWRKCYFDVAPSARLARARRIYNTYVASSGNFPVNIPWDVATKIRAAVMAEGLGDCSEKVFDEARQEITDLLQLGAVARFSDSKYCKEYLESNGAKGHREVVSMQL